MEDDRNYNTILFNLIKNHKWIEFENEINKIDKCDVNVRDNSNNYLIQYALMFNKRNIVKLLVNRKAKLDIMDSDGHGLLFIPIKFGYDDLLEDLLTVDKSNIGISLVNIQDDTHHTPLHYAIMFNNITAVKLLLKYLANIDIQDKLGNSSIHLSIIQKNIDIINILLKPSRVGNVIAPKSNLNLRCKTGETPLHLACNFELYDVIKILLIKKADVNATDYDNELTPILYAITLNRIDIIKLLLEFHADPNIADQYGNNAFHYSIYENRHDIFEIIMEIEKKDLNLTNIESKTICHLIFDNNDVRKNEKIKYIDKIIKFINLNIQDNNGDTCLMHLIRFELWEKYYKDLRSKKLDIYVTNKNGENCKMLIEKYDEKQQTLFMTLVTDSFYYYITNNPTEKIFIDWQKECNITKNKNVCKRKIEKYIVNNQISIPNFNKYNLQISQGDLVKFGTFTGIVLDVLCGLLYLLNKYKFIKSSITTDFINNNALLGYYINLGITNIGPSEYLNFEILWINNKLYTPNNLTTTITKFKEDVKKNEKLRFFIAPLGIEIKHDSHANYIIYDTKTNELERFEPHGSRNPNKFNYNSLLMDQTLKQYFIDYFPNLKYIKPSDYLPKVGYQLLDNSERNKYRNIGDPSGFCALWCIWYVDMRLSYPDVPRNKLVETTLNIIKYKGLSFRTLIRNYSIKITNVRDEILKYVDIDINDWLNDNYTDAQINEINSIIKKKIESITL